MQVRPITPELLIHELAERIEKVRGRWTRVAIDGAAGTAEFADKLVEPLRVRGREAVRVRTTDYLRPASLRLEHGHHDPDSYYTDWFDFGGLRREVLAPLSEHGTGHVLPALWDAEAERSPRLDRVQLAERGIALVNGPFLVGMPFDFIVHLWLPGNSLQRRLPEAEHWKLSAFERYSEEIDPEHLADCVVRADRPGHPAIVDSF